MRDWPLTGRKSLIQGLLVGGMGTLPIVVLLLVSSGAVTGTCADDLAFEGPDTTVSISHDQSTDAVLVTHRDGESLTADRTDQLLVSIHAADSGNSTRYILASATDAFPISPGDRFTIRNATADGRSLTAGDVIKLVWRGSEKPLPAYCLGDQGGGSSSMVLEQYVVD